MVIPQLLSPTPSQTAPPPEELVSMLIKWANPPDAYRGFACLPYIKGLTKPLMRLLRNNEIRVVSKPFKILQQEFPSPKFRQPMDLQTNVVYKIPCSDCSWNYIGETGRCFQTRKKEHKRNLKNYAKGSNIANHAWSDNHLIDFENARVIIVSVRHWNPGILRKPSMPTITQNRCLGNIPFFYDYSSFVIHFQLSHIFYCIFLLFC